MPEKLARSVVVTPCCRHHSLTERPLLRHSWICAAHSCSSARCFNSALVILTPHNTTVAKPFATFRYYCLMCVYARLGLTVTRHLFIKVNLKRMVNTIFRYFQIYCSAGTTVGFSRIFAFVNRSVIVHYRLLYAGRFDAYVPSGRVRPITPQMRRLPPLVGGRSLCVKRLVSFMIRRQGLEAT